MTKFLQYPYLSLLLFTSVLGLLNMKRLTTPFKFLAILVLITFINEMLAEYLHQIKNNHLPVYHIYTVIHVVTVGGIYLTLLKGKKVRRYVLTGTAICLAFTVVNMIAIQGYKRFPYYDLIVISIFYVSYALLGNFEMIRLSSNQKVLQTGNFWLNSGVLIFFSINFILWSLYNYLIRVKAPVINDLFNLLYILNFIMYILFALAIYFDSRRLKLT